jgi:putative ABC transport system permease protein
LVLLVDLRRGRALDAVYLEGGAPGNALGRRVQRPLFAAALGLVAAASLLFALAPSLAIIACLLLAVATVLAVPVGFAGLLRAVGALAARDQKLTILPVALKALRTTTLRSLALAATSAVALFGAVALGGARDDLLRGIGGSARGYASDAGIWVVSPGDNQATVSFLPGDLPRLIARAPGVSSVRTFFGGFDELGDRRVWVIARPPGTGLRQLNNQTVDGSAAVAVSRLGEGGWIVIPQQVAEEHHVRVGQSLALPTPSGSVPFRIAATTTNLGWPTGVIVMNTADYTRAWRTSAPTALGVVLKPGVKVSQALSTIGRYLGPGSGLEAVPAPSRAARIETSSSEGTSQLAEISTLLVIAAILAMSAALGSAIWQRRPSLASLRLAGAPPGRLRQVLIMEAALTLSAGCATGLVAGIYGQVVIDRYLKHVTGFPVASLGASWRPLVILAVVVAAVLALVAVPAWFAARVPLALALQDE